MARGEKRRALSRYGFKGVTSNLYKSLVITLCICSTLFLWNQMQNSMKGLPPATMVSPICRETTEILKDVSDLMKNQRVIRTEEVEKFTISDPPKSHQVFINFRGELRHNFFSHLTNAFKNRGIKFFIDNDMLPGNDLKNLFVEIEESRIALAIFSKRYPESKWCMNELVKMKKLSDEGKLHIIPIYYKVTARDVKQLTRESEFGKNFWRLMETSDRRDPIQKWKEALECISNKLGLTLGEKSSEADFVEKIVKDVERVKKKFGLEEEENHGGKIEEGYRKFLVER